jgi:hypothetical protein
VLTQSLFAPLTNKWFFELSGCTIVMLAWAAKSSGDWGYAATVGGQIQACEFFLQNTGCYAHFSYLVRNINRFFRTGIAPYSASRTLLTTGIADASLRSVAAGGARIDTPTLHISYKAFDDFHPPIRPYKARPTGPTLDLDTPDDNWSQGSSRWRHPLGKLA